MYVATYRGNCICIFVLCSYCSGKLCVFKMWKLGLFNILLFISNNFGVNVFGWNTLFITLFDFSVWVFCTFIPRLVRKWIHNIFKFTIECLRKYFSFILFIVWNECHNILLPYRMGDWWRRIENDKICYQIIPFELSKVIFVPLFR